MNQHDDPGNFDWLDLGPDPDEGKPSRDPRLRYLWYGAAVVAVVLALVLTRTQHGSNRSAASPGSPSRTGASSSPRPSAPSVQPSSTGSFVDPPSSAPFPSGSGVQARNAGHRLLDVPADWELFARAPGMVVRIQLALGRVTSTAIPGVSNDLPVLFVAAADRVFIRTQDNTPGAVVRDGQSATELPKSFLRGSTLLPGPDQRHLWAETDSALELFTLDGRPAGTRIEVPGYASVMGSDGAGYVLLSGIGGTYAARPGTAHRVTSGQLMASGPTRWLSVECDDSLRCDNVVTERATGAHHFLNTPIDPYQLMGVISPDGRTAALPRSDGGITTDEVDLLDLDTGIHRSAGVTVNTSQGGPSLVWSPDSRWLFAIDDYNRVMIVNRASGRAAPISVQLPPVVQLALRYGSG